MALPVQRAWAVPLRVDCSQPMVRCGARSRALPDPPCLRRLAMCCPIGTIASSAPHISGPGGVRGGPRRAGRTRARRPLPPGLFAGFPDRPGVLRRPAGSCAAPELPARSAFRCWSTQCPSGKVEKTIREGRYEAIANGCVCWPLLPFPLTCGWGALPPVPAWGNFVVRGCAPGDLLTGSGRGATGSGSLPGAPRPLRTRLMPRAIPPGHAHLACRTARPCRVSKAERHALWQRSSAGHSDTPMRACRRPVQVVPRVLSTIKILVLAAIP